MSKKVLVGDIRHGICRGVSGVHGFLKRSKVAHPARRGAACDPHEQAYRLNWASAACSPCRPPTRWSLMKICGICRTEGPHFS